MRLVLASDLHYQLRQYDWLIDAAARFDAVVVAGDHLDIASPVPPEVQIAALRASLRAIAAASHLLVCSGNHDLNARNGAGEKTADWLGALSGSRVAVDGESLSVGTVRFTVCPWWDGPSARAGVEALLDRESAHRGLRWIWVYHAPPQGALSWTGKRHFGDPLLPALIERHAPTAVLCGHVHEAPFREGGSWIERVGASWVFNPGRQPGSVPARIEIDFTQALARWITHEGTETRSLAADQ
jgi:hypothetical protein